MDVLVESHADPSSWESFKLELKDDDTFETDFISASEQDWKKWALEMQSKHLFIEQNIIAIADARSASDGTLLMQHYVGEESCFPIGRYGVLPREHDVWFDYKINYNGAAEVIIALTNGPYNSVYPIYYGNKKELTNELGIFDVTKAHTSC